MIHVCSFGWLVVWLVVWARYIKCDGWYLFQLQHTLCWELSALQSDVYLYLQAFKVFQTVWTAMHTMRGECMSFICTSYDLFVCQLNRGTQACGVWEWDAEEGIWISEWGVNRRLEETAWWEALLLYVIFMYSAALFIDINCCRSESLFTQLF